MRCPTEKRRDQTLKRDVREIVIARGQRGENALSGFVEKARQLFLALASLQRTRFRALRLATPALGGDTRFPDRGRVAQGAGLLRRLHAQERRRALLHSDCSRSDLPGGHPRNRARTGTTAAAALPRLYQELLTAAASAGIRVYSVEGAKESSQALALKVSATPKELLLGLAAETGGEAFLNGDRAPTRSPRGCSPSLSC